MMKYAHGNGPLGMALCRDKALSKTDRCRRGVDVRAASRCPVATALQPGLPYPLFGEAAVRRRVPGIGKLRW